MMTVIIMDIVDTRKEACYEWVSYITIPVLHRKLCGMGNRTTVSKMVWST